MPTKNHGFTLIEIMISCSVLSILLLSVTQLTQITANLIKNGNAIKNILYVKSLLSNINSTNQTCIDTFTINGTVPTLSIGQTNKNISFNIPNPQGNPTLIGVNSVLGNYTITQSSITLGSLSSNDLQGNKIIQGELQLTLSDNTLLNKIHQTITPYVYLTIALNSSSQMSSCGPFTTNGGNLSIPDCKTSNGEYLQWDGIRLSCRQIICPAGQIQYGLSGPNINCIPYGPCLNDPTISTPNIQIPVFLPLYSQFKCKTIFCTNPGEFPTNLDLDGFINSCSP